MVKVNFSNVQDFDPLPAGVYGVTVTAVEERESQSSEYTYFNWELTVNDDSEYNGRKLWTITSLSPKAAFKLKETLVAFGEDPEALADPDGFDMDETNYIGAECQATVSQETYEGRIQNRVQALHPLGVTVEEEKAAAKKAQPAPGRRVGGRSVR